MEYKHLGRSGLKVSQLALGTMNFGWVTDESAAFSIMDQALDYGINLFDSADVYGGPQTPDMEQGYGTSEEIIGRWLDKGGRRDRIVLATKAYQPMGAGPNDQHLSAYHIRKACEDSLRRLQTDHIDLYQMHHIDRSTPWEEIWQAVTATLIGARTPEQLAASQRALQVRLSEDALGRLDKIWPGPGGEAPQAYAW